MLFVANTFLLVLTSLSLPLLLANNYLWAGLGVLAITHLLGQLSTHLASTTSSKRSSQVLQSTTSAAVTFIIIGSLGYANIVSWSIIAPLLILPYLISYMGLRIGIATKSEAPKASRLATASIPIASVLIILASVDNIHIYEQSLADCIGAILLLLFIGLSYARIKLAYTLLLTTKP